ncbi:MAG TPA: class I adenylate-forming enzyme family protein, partial [Polyangiaceae bacterium]|nr:class I adenylate-forming enzyme family protein [Polyangiaceae bacterium]
MGSSEPMPQSAAIYQRFREIAQRDPAAGALIADAQRWDYGQLLSRVEQCAAGLRQAGVQWGDAVVVVLPNAPDFVVTTLATFAIGAVLVPLNPRYKADEIEQHLQLSQPRVVVYAPSLQTLFSNRQGA